MITHLTLFTAACLLLASLAHGQDADPIAKDPGALQRRGGEHFFAGRIEEALTDWDRVITLVPEQGPYHWQRGIALYYAGKFELGAAQFESHQNVNRNDVENAACPLKEWLAPAASPLARRDPAAPPTACGQATRRAPGERPALNPDPIPANHSRPIAIPSHSGSRRATRG